MPQAYGGGLVVRTGTGLARVLGSPNMPWYVITPAQPPHPVGNGVLEFTYPVVLDVGPGRQCISFDGFQSSINAPTTLDTILAEFGLTQNHLVEVASAATVRDVADALYAVVESNLVITPIRDPASWRIEYRNGANIFSVSVHADRWIAGSEDCSGPIGQGKIGHYGEMARFYGSWAMTQNNGG
jgi:hypothetical protein